MHLAEIGSSQLLSVEPMEEVLLDENGAGTSVEGISVAFSEHGLVSTEAKAFSCRLQDFCRRVELLKYDLSSITPEAASARITTFFEELEDFQNGLYALSQNIDISSLRQEFSCSEKALAAVNIRTKSLTILDLRGLSSFFVRPEGKVCKGKDGQSYIQPDNSQIFSLSLRYLNSCYYQKCGISKNTMINGRVCDQVYMGKEPDQIAYEKERKKEAGNFFTKWWKHDSSMEKRIERQLEAAHQVNEAIRSLYQDWGYAGYEICGEERLCQLGVSRKDASCYHLIVFYYQKSPSSNF